MSIETTPNFALPSNPAERQALEIGLKDIVNMMTKIDGYRDTIREGLKEMEERYEIKAKYLRKLASAYHKQEMAARAAEMETLQEMYDALFGKSEKS